MVARRPLESRLEAEIRPKDRRINKCRGFNVSGTLRVPLANGTRSVPDTFIDSPVLKAGLRAVAHWITLYRPESAGKKVSQYGEHGNSGGDRAYNPIRQEHMTHFPVSIVLYIRRPRPINMRLRVFSLRGQSGPNNR